MIRTYVRPPTEPAAPDPPTARSPERRSPGHAATSPVCDSHAWRGSTAEWWGLGYARASFAQIARRAGLSSPGLISYHFANKDDLIGQVVAEIYATGGAVVRPHSDGATSAWRALRGYLEGSIAFYDTHRTHMRALVQILQGHPEALGRWVGARNSAELDGVVEVLVRGQRAGEFREFEPRTVAVIIRQMLSGALQQLLTQPDLDLTGYTHELVAMCEHAVAAPERRADD